MSSLTNSMVPTAAFIEHFVIEYALVHNVSIESASTAVLPRSGLSQPKVFLHVETRLLGMLYTLLVFPHETWKREGLIAVVIERAKLDADLKPSSQEILTEGFLRSIRNSVAHARISFRDGKVAFQDQKAGSEPHFVEELIVEDAVNLLLVLGRAFHECTRVSETITKALRS